MSSWRALLLAGLVAVVVALTWTHDGRSAPSAEGLESTPVPAAGNPGSLSSTWFCAAGAAGTPEAPRHELVLVNPAGETAQARLSAYGPEGLTGEQQVEVVAPGPTVIDVGELFGATGRSVMVESDAGELVVEHRLVAPSGSDQVPCATSSSDRWYFPSQATIRGTTAQLHLFNPFSSDAGVDLTITDADGVRVPRQWQGLVVPAGTTEVIDLGTRDVGGAQVRDQFAVTVALRKGRVIAETAQTVDIPADDEAATPASRGLRLQLGVPAAASTWSFAQGFTGRGVNERLVVFNPGEESAEVVVQVTPYGAGELPPEPFELDVPARRISVLDLSAETRIPGVGLHAITVQSVNRVDVVAGRVVSITGGRAPGPAEIVRRPGLTLGAAIGTGTPVASPLWAITGLLVGPSQDSQVLVHNPGTGIAVATVTIIGGSGDGTVLADAVEIAPGDSVAVRAGDAELGSGRVNALVEADAPVVVERTITFDAQDDLSMGLAVPLPSDASALSDLGS